MSERVTGDACPCCGDIALPKHMSASRPNSQAPYGLESEPRFYYECRNCGLRTKDYPTQREALEAWNTRAERTCYIRDIRDYANGARRFFLSCGHVIEKERGGFFTYCEECGARLTNVQ